MKISVALSTYNGEKYIAAQLRSIVEQTVLPGEIVICDDCSVDSTVSRVEEFARESPVPVRLFRNESNLGVTRNFAKCVALASGDYIALSDQDDVWYPRKLETLVEAFGAHPELDVIFHDLDLVQDDLEPLGRTLWKYVGFGKHRRSLWLQGKTLEVLYSAGNVVTGCALMFRATVKERLLTAIGEDMFGDRLHDHILALITAPDAKIGFVEDRLGAYRQHGAQVVGTTASTGRLENIKGGTEGLRTILDTYTKDRQAYTRLRIPAANLSYLEARIAHYTTRISYSPVLWKRAPQVLREWLKGNYKLSSGILSAFKDMLRR